MIQNLRKRLREIAFLHNAYMRTKRMFSAELLGMTSGTEQAYIATYGENLYSGGGEVVDLGSWLGSTTIPLTKGLLKNPNFRGQGRKVYAYDLFIWFDWMIPSVAGTDLAGRYAEGDNFVDEFKRRIAPIADSVDVREGDLKSIGWHGEPIEFLLVDAMKGWDLAASIVRDFYPSLIEGRSLVFHQDFAHHFTPWIHLVQWRLRDHFEFVDEVPRSQSVVFRCVKAISTQTVELDWGFGLFDDNDVDAAFEYSFGLVTSEKQANVAAAKVMWYVHQDELDDASRVLADLTRSGIPLENELLIVSELLAGKTK